MIKCVVAINEEEKSRRNTIFEDPHKCQLYHIVAKLQL
jgi:hypothetical protein